jgi:hypothetical protein
MRLTRLAPAVWLAACLTAATAFAQKPVAQAAPKPLPATCVTCHPEKTDYGA